MSNTITVAHIKGFENLITLKYQQDGSVMASRVRQKPSSAKYEFFELIAPTAMVKKTVRHGATPLVNSQHSRRRAEKTDYEWADLVDKEDLSRMLVNPTSAYAQNASMSAGRHT